jgi:two-component system, NtrC family, sensor kinase
VKTGLGTAIAGSPSELLPPCAETVVALAEALGAGSNTLPLRALLLGDPGALVVFLGLSPEHPAGSKNPTENLDDAALALPLWTAMANAAGTAFADWSRPAASRAYRFAQRASWLARHLTESLAHSSAELALASGLAAPDAAAIAGLLSPLGWLVSQHEGKSKFASGAAAALTRRLARDWALPSWLANVLLSLDLSAPLAGALACDARFLWIVQAAVGLAQERTGAECSVKVGNSPDEALARLGLVRPAAEVLPSLLAAAPALPGGGASSPATLLWRMGRLAVERRTTEGSCITMRLEAEAEQLREQLADARNANALRLRDLKLRALAEFAAGAGHEINNPLAVISGQAQHLLKTEEHLERARALERIIAQCQRIHTLLRDLMLYARPPDPKPRMLSLNRIVADVQAELAEYALERRVVLQIEAGAAKIRLRADGELLRNALGCLLRNAIEAAPADGWARMRLEPADATVAVVVEDSGAGLSAHRQEHLFDPFFSSRLAGRGAGLGLSKAWRIAQLHHGALEVQTIPGEPTRFVLTLPRDNRTLQPLRQKAAARRTRRRR